MELSTTPQRGLPSRASSLKHRLARLAGACGGWSLARRLTPRVPRIFMFHRFSAGPSPRATDAAEFRRFLLRVREECELLTVRELAARLDAPRAPRRPLAAITVDDGYADFHAVALPILRELGIPATLYATAGFVNQSAWLWWDALRWLVDAQPAGPLAVDVAGARLEFSLDDQASRDRAWSGIADRLVSDNAARAAVREQLERSGGCTLPERPTAAYAAMDWAQLAEAEAAGVEIGGHTLTHAFLPTLDAAALHAELVEARALLERHLAEPVTTFAYPNGAPEDWSPEVEAALQAAGYTAAVLAHPRPFRAADRYRLGRWSAHSGELRMEHILSGASALKLAWSARA